MRKVTLRLLRKFAALTGRNEEEMKKWWKGLTREQRHIAGEQMKATIEKLGGVKAPS